MKSLACSAGSLALLLSLGASAQTRGGGGSRSTQSVFLAPNCDATGATDATSCIQTAINTTKCVVLAAGTYSVTGLTAVNGGCLMGMGQTATLRLAAGATIALSITVPNFSVRGLRFDGGNQGPYDLISVVAGTRSAIWAAGPSVAAGIYNVTIEDCYATGFDNNGVYVSNTAQATGGEPGMPVVNLVRFTAYHNYNGIFLDQLGEYVQATNCNSSFAFAAIRVIGGNNRIVNSHFSKSFRNAMVRTGTNSVHGAFIGSSFNHMSTNSSTGVDVSVTTNGELFVGCEFWYSNIQITDSGDIVIKDSVIGNATITTVWTSATGLGTNIIEGNSILGTSTRTFATNANIKLVWRGNTFSGVAGPTALTYAATVNVDASASEDFTVTPTNGTAFTIADPTNWSVNARLVIRLINTFGTLGAVTMGTHYKFVGAPTFPVVPNGSNLAIEFRYDGTNWVEVARTGNVPN